MPRKELRGTMIMWSTPGAPQGRYGAPSRSAMAVRAWSPASLPGANARGILLEARTFARG